jgi:hypothetical protein
MELLLPSKRRLFVHVKLQQSRIDDAHKELRFDVLDVQKSLRAEESLSTERVLVGTGSAFDAFPGQIRIVDRQQIRVACILYQSPVNL